MNHVAAEAIARSIPLGIALSDSARSFLLMKEHNVPFTSGIAVSLTRRLFLAITQVVFVLVAIAFSWQTVAGVVSSIAGRTSFTHDSFVVILMIVLVCATLIPFIFYYCSRKGFAGPLQSLSKVAQSLRLKNWRGFAASLSLLSLIWLMEFLETYMVLKALGFGVGLQQALALEASVSLARAAVFFLPSGIGVQEAGYIGTIATLGIEGTNVSTFLIIKRARDTFWILLGYGILASKGLTPLRMIFATEKPSQ